MLEHSSSATIDHGCLDLTGHGHRVFRRRSGIPLGSAGRHVVLPVLAVLRNQEVLLGAEDGAWPDNPQPSDGLTSGKPIVLHHPQSDQSTSAAKACKTVYSHASLLGVADVQELCDDVIRRDSAVVEVEVVVPDAGLLEDLCVVRVGFVEPDDRSDAELVKQGHEVLRGHVIPALVSGSTESPELGINTGHVHVLAVQDFVGVKVKGIDVEPAQLHRLVDPRAAVQDGHVEARGREGCVAKVVERGIEPVSEGGSSLLRQVPFLDDQICGEEEAGVGDVVRFEAAVVYDIALLELGMLHLRLHHVAETRHHPKVNGSKVSAEGLVLLVQVRAPEEQVLPGLDLLPREVVVTVRSEVQPSGHHRKQRALPPQLCGLAHHLLRIRSLAARRTGG
mmetsp:Transcript_23027/g.36036  ORF Transcript_23027/g.36036 Transcript_23027/m.36036 type:complete len:392 (+) Transcript_23027:147-1322(+)